MMDNVDVIIKGHTLQSAIHSIQSGGDRLTLRLPRPSIKVQEESSLDIIKNILL